ncbi:3-hydroxyacyl-CoA dehydrogenase family protein [Bacteroidota bacterium]
MKKVVIIGGQTAASIGELFASAGIPVAILDSLEDKAGELVGADIVIEAVGGDGGMSKEVILRCDEVIPPEAILATTASSAITELAVLTQKPSRFVGLHFTFNPFQDGCLVQITKGLETAAETVDACRDLIEKVGATAIEVADQPGLVLDRVMASAINEAAVMHMTKVATVEDIDSVAKSCLNWPVGPFQFADVIGIDNVLATLEVLSREVSPRFLPCRIFKQMVAAGWLGKKAGRGFYTYR